MSRRRSFRIVAAYVVSLAATIALLVVWVVYVVRSASKINDLAERVRESGGGVHWVVLTVGCSLLFLMIVGLTYQLAVALAARRYSLKQEEFVSNITHEMKSPLAGIKLHAQTLERPGLPEAQRQRSVAFILAEAERMETLVDNVLESGRLLARKRLLDLAPVDLGEFFAAYFEDARSRAESQGVRLRVDGATRSVVRTSPVAMERVMTNLLDNAARFSGRGGEVRCRLGDAPGKVRIEVEDDGIGIPKGELGKIFDRFYQIGRGISGRRRGTGLGLSIVSGLVREMRGTVQAFSQEGRPGTRFVVELPTVEEQGT
jgi:signal transduction histidine kinase